MKDPIIEHRDKMFVIIDELNQYVDLEYESEWSDTASAMITLWNQRTLLSDKFTKQLEAEIKRWLKHVKKYTEITEEVIVPDNKPITVKTLEWL